MKKVFKIWMVVFFISSCKTFNTAKNLQTAESLYHSGKTTSAVQAFSNIIIHNDTCYEAYMYRGFAYKDQEKYDSALMDFNKLISLKPADETGYANRATIFYQNNDYQHALKDFTKALSLNPKAKILYNPICHMLFATGQKEEACKYYQMALSEHDSLDFDSSIIKYCRHPNFR